MPEIPEPLRSIIAQALRDGRPGLGEHEVLDLLEALGRPTPARRFVARPDMGAPAAYAPLATGSTVLKIVSDDILHKTDVGAVCFAEPGPPVALAQRSLEMLAGLPPDLQPAVRGVLVVEAVAHRPTLGRELLLGLRDTDDFGPVLTFGLGGTAVETLADALHTAQGTVLCKPGTTGKARLADKLRRALFYRLATGAVRGIEAVASPTELEAELGAWQQALLAIHEAVARSGGRAQEIELNPVVWADRWLPLDGLLRFGRPLAPRRRPTPPARLRRALRPHAVGIVGVSASSAASVGRLILRSALDGGFPPEHTYVVHRRAPSIDGVRCVAAIAELPEPVDLLVLAVQAAEVPAILADAIGAGTVGAVLLIAGGMGETVQGRDIERGVLAAIDDAPAAAQPAVIGNNSLGMLCRTGRLDTLFIPRRKLPRAPTAPSGLAIVSQSGAFMIAQLSRWQQLSPDYLLSIGNQIDATAADFVDALFDDDGIETLALYLEGVKPADGARLCAAVRRWAEAGRDVIVYKGGRSPHGQAAARGHTASVAGDHRVLTELLTDAGALVADGFAELMDLARLSTALRGKRFRGRRVALLSNAGYEAVGMADRCGRAPERLEPAALGAATQQRLAAALAAAHLDALVQPANPLDVTPMADDQVHEQCARALLADPDVDVAVLGAVPFTARMKTLADDGCADGLEVEGAYSQRIGALFREQTKPLCVVVDAGPLYEPLRQSLAAAGVPVFDRSDVAVERLGRYVAHRLCWPRG